MISLRYLPGLPKGMEMSYYDQGQEVLIVWVAKPLNFLEQGWAIKAVETSLRMTTRPLQPEPPAFKPPKGWKPPKKRSEDGEL